VAADWHELFSTAEYCAAIPLPALTNNWILGEAGTDTTSPSSQARYHPIASKLLLISSSAEGRRLI